MVTNQSETIIFPLCILGYFFIAYISGIEFSQLINCQSIHINTVSKLTLTTLFDLSQL